MRKTVTAVLVLAALALAGCGTAASSGQIAAENKLLASLQAHFSPAHPVKSVQAAVKAVYPQGSTAAIEANAVAHFTPAVMTTSGPGSARDRWLQEVTAFAESQGASPPAASS